MVRSPSVAEQDFYIADKLSGIASRKERKYGNAVRIARTQEELKAAYRIIYQEYVTRGFCRPDESRMHYNTYCFLPCCRTFILKKNGKIIGTLSLIMDSKHGLPSESAFAGEIGALKTPASRMAEIGLFGLDRNFFREEDHHLANFRKLGAAFTLFREMFAYAKKVSITDFVIAVHPKKEPLYRSLTFRKIGAERPYRSACGNPAIAMHMNIQRWFEITSQEQRMKSYFLRESSEGLSEDSLECSDWAGSVAEGEGI